ncbi:MAG: class I SAM-dependent methyltransferase [Planctomycetota bacterium]|nr:class I SAM-dependent methyltransferase [Planctomycetota bacterium]
MNPRKSPLSSEADIQNAYFGTRVAEAYVAGRFESELNRILHRKQVAAVNKVMMEHLPVHSLEIAPGPGRVTREVTPTGKLTCLEYNAGMIEQGKQNCLNVNEWVQGNAFELPFEEPFEFVYTFRFIRHFKHEDRQRLYSQIKRVLTPGGYLVFDAVCERFSKPLRLAKPEDYPIYDKLYPRGELLKELSAAGFRVTKLIAVQKFFRWQYLSQVMIGPRANWLNRLIVGGLESLPRQDGLEWIIVCRRA